MHRWLLISLSLAWSVRGDAAPPPGQSALLNGMHDPQALSWMKGATSGCDKGWLVALGYIGTSGTVSPDCHDDATAAGVAIIERLDVGGTISYPASAGQVSGYATAFAGYAAKCSKIHVWIVGNEPNVMLGKNDPDCSSASYARAYAAVHRALHAVSGHRADLVLVAPNSPYSPGCLESLRTIIARIKALGVTPDGFALHAYTRANSASSLTSGYVTDTSRQSDTTIDQCAGGATWNDTWYKHFRIYRDYIAVIEAAGLAGRPVFISETGNACKSGACYPDRDIGYFQALYAEVARHNATARTKIRAVTPYRWTGYSDGTSRDFAIGKRPKLLADLKKAFAKKYRWTASSCQASRCRDDAGCSGRQICDLSRSTCTATSRCDASGGCARSTQLCRRPQLDCVPRLRGAARLDVSPANPRPATSATFDASATQGYTNVGMSVSGPAGKVTLTGPQIVQRSGRYHWIYRGRVGRAGTYRATFTADPGKQTVYAIRYFFVGTPPAPPASGGLDGSTSGGPGSSDAGGGGGTLGGGCACDGAATAPIGPPLLLPLALVLLLAGRAGARWASTRRTRTARSSRRRPARATRSTGRK